MADKKIDDAATVFTPAHPGGWRDRKDFVFEVRRLASGEPAAMAFTTRERLAGGLGPSQPWIVISLGRLRAVMAAAGVSQVAVDPEISPDAMRWRQGDVEELMKREES